jgi:hypothetical protein
MEELSEAVFSVRSVPRLRKETFMLCELGEVQLMSEWEWEVSELSQ